MATAKSRKPPPPPPPLPPFRFGARKDRIDWGALHGVDIERMVCSCVCSGGGPIFFVSPPTSETSLATSHFHSFLPSFLVFLKQAATTDLDALEKCVSSVAYGNLDAEPRGKLSEVKKEEGRRTRERETKKKRFFSGSEKIKSLIGVFFSFPILSLFFNARPSLPGLPPPPVPRSAADRAVPPARPG